jgi:cellulose synthase/poly-beta-1,6-N-acetylglucosamine synthase-like glycosyltransferase
MARYRRMSAAEKSTRARRATLRGKFPPESRLTEIMLRPLPWLLLSFLLVVAYTWIGYPLCLWLLHKFLRMGLPRGQKRSSISSISIIIAVHNEEAQIAAKLEDCQVFDYPPELIEILVASDGSTDNTEKIVAGFAGRDARIRLLRTSGRMGKSGAQNLAVEQARGKILLFTDAATRIGRTALSQIASHFADAQIGLVAPVVRFGKFDTSVSHGQGAYWRFEIFLRQLESDLGILATASGAALAVRRKLYRPIPPQFGDDCVIPLDVRLGRSKVVQDPEAEVYDEMPHSVEGEFRARVRMTARNWTGIVHRCSLLDPLRFPGTAWSLVSHKFLRWLTPFFLAGALLLNIALAIQGRMTWLLILQSCFYLAAAVGWQRSRERSCARIFGYPFAFCLANLGFLLGVVRGLRRQTVVAYK